MPKITEAAGGEIATWQDGVAFPGFDTSNPGARDVYLTMETIRTADAVFEGKEVRKPFDTPAAAGSDQSDATALTKGQNNVTGADGTKGIALPAATAGDEVVIVNTDPGELLKVYPVYGGAAAINGLAANIAFTMQPGERRVFIAESATQWRTGGFQPAIVTFTIAIAASATTDGMDITITAVDENGDTVAGLRDLMMWMTDAATGAGLTADSFSGDLTAGTGAIIGALTAKKAWMLQTGATGVFVGTLVDSANPADVYVAVRDPVGGLPIVSEISDDNWEGA